MLANSITRASDYERVKASTLRRKPTHTKQQREWLTAYDARVAAARASRKSERLTNTQAGFAQSTAPPDAYNGTSDLWAPVIPAASVDEPDAPPGVEPPKPGDPVIASAAPAGDPGAAQQCAMLMAMIVRAGIVAAMELLADVQLPDQYRELLSSSASHNEVIVACSASAYRLALKYNVSALPMSDELTVAAATAGSAAAWFAVHKRKRRAAAAEAEAQRPAQAKDANVSHDPARTEGDAPQARSPVPGVW